MSGEKLSKGGSGAAAGQLVDVPILGLLQTEDEMHDYTNDTIAKTPKVI